MAHRPVSRTLFEPPPRPRNSARTSIAGPGRRAAARSDAQQAIDAAGKPSFTAQDASPAYLILRRALFEYLRSLPLGVFLQAADFDRWLCGGSDGISGCSFAPSAGWSSIDRRATGSLFIALRSAGVLSHHSYRCTGGSASAHSTARPVYRLDAYPIDAPCDAPRAA